MLTWRLGGATYRSESRTLSDADRLRWREEDQVAAVKSMKGLAFLSVALLLAFLCVRHLVTHDSSSVGQTPSADTGRTIDSSLSEIMPREPGMVGRPAGTAVEDGTAAQMESGESGASAADEAPDALRDRNHRALVKLMMDIDAYLENARTGGLERIKSPPFQNWSAILYRDGLANGLLSHEVSADTRVKLRELLHSPGDPSYQALTLTDLDAEYLRRLVALLNSTSGPKARKSSANRELEAVARYRDLAKKRKWRSVTRMLPELKRMLVSDSISVENKITRSQRYVDFGDEFLIKYVAEYFHENSLEGNWSDVDRRQADEFVREMIGRL